MSERVKAWREAMRYVRHCEQFGLNRSGAIIREHYQWSRLTTDEKAALRKEREG